VALAQLVDVVVRKGHRLLSSPTGP
jgi:hypothetical protein